MTPTSRARRSLTWSRARWAAGLGALMACLLTAAPAALAQTGPAPTGPDSTAPPSTPPTTTPTVGSTTGPTSTLPPGGFGGPGTTLPGAPPEPPMPDPTPQVHVLLAQLVAQDHQKVVQLAEAAVAARQADQDRAGVALQAAEADLGRARDVVAADVRRLRLYALYAYVDPGDPVLEQLVDPKPVDSSQRGVLLQVAVDRGHQVLLHDRATVTRKEGVVADRRGDLAAATQRTSDAASVRDGVRHDQAKLESELSTAVSTQHGHPDWELPIMGESVFTPPELAAWFAQHKVVSRAQAPISALATWYIDEGHTEGVRGDMAFAQSILETGSFTNDDTIRLNNFAGVGHCDTCPEGFAFATPQLGVRAQIQLLKGYVEARPEYKNPLVDRRLRGPAGCCQTWTQLTHTWATNGNYGPKILGVYRDMLHWLVIQRGMQPLDSGP